MITKTVRSRFNHEIGEKVEGCTILERRVIIPPVPNERRLGVYDYLVEVPPAAVNARESHSRAAKSSSKHTATARASAPEQGSFTRATPEEMTSVIRRVPSR